MKLWAHWDGCYLALVQAEETDLDGGDQVSFWRCVYVLIHMDKHVHMFE